LLPRPRPGNGGKHRIGRNDDAQRLQAAGVERDVVIDQGPEDVEHGGHGHARGRVEVAGQLRRGAGEVDLGGSLLVVDPDRDLDHRAVVQLVGELPVMPGGDHPPDRLGRVFLHVAMYALTVGSPKCSTMRCSSAAPLAFAAI